MHSRKAGFSATVSPLALIILASMLGADRRIGVGPAQDIDPEGIRTNLGAVLALRGAFFKAESAL